MFHYVKENVMFNLGASLCSDGDLMGRMGVSFRVGQGGKKKPELASDMVTMQAQLVRMQYENDGLKDEVAELKERNERNEEALRRNEQLILELTKRLEANN